MDKEAILRTVQILIYFENKGLLCNWEIKREYNSWSAWYPYQYDTFLITGCLLSTTKETIFSEFNRVKKEYKKWLNS